MKFAKASITRQGSCGSSDSSAYSQKGRGGDFRFCSRDPDPRSRDGSPEQYDDATAVCDVTNCVRVPDAAVVAWISGPSFSGTKKAWLPQQSRTPSTTSSYFVFF